MRDYISQYGDRVDSDDPGFPAGKFKNREGGAGTGTPLDAAWANDINGFMQAALADAGLEADGSQEQVGQSQVLAAIKSLIINNSADFSIPSTESLISSANLSYQAGNVLLVLGYSTKGDGGATFWRATDETGLEISQSPSDLNAAAIVDATGRKWVLYSEFVTPLMLGAKGDGVSDDTPALAAAIASGLPVRWGKSEYAINGSVSLSITHGIVWSSEGAKIKNISSAPVRTTLEILSDGQHHHIAGPLTIDANNNSYIALRIENTSGDKGSIIAEDLTCINAYRSGTEFSGGSGLNIKGYFERVHLTRPTVKNVHLGAGAGIPGIVGVAGILIEPKSTTPFQAVEKVYIEDAHIEDVYSDDLAYVVDQDGMNIRTASDDPAIDLPWPTDVNIEGGVFKNCWGRSIKCQSENGNVDGAQFIRTTGNEHNGSEIDFQVGAGNVSNIKCIYEVFTPRYIVTMSGARRTGKLVPYGSVSGVKASIATGESIEAVVNCANREFTQQSWSVRDIVVRGQTQYIIKLTGGDNSDNVLNLTDVTVDTLSEYLVWTGVNSFSDKARVYINRATHFGTPVPIFRANSASSPLLSCDEVFGFISDDSLDQETGTSYNSGPFKRVDRIAPVDVRESGFIKPVSLKLAGNSQGVFPKIGYNSNSGMIILSCSGNRNAKAIFSYDTDRVIQIAGETVDFSVGTTTEPTTGNFRLWIENGVVNLSNRSVFDRMFTCLMMG